MTEREIEQSISIFVRSYADGAIGDLEAVKQRAQALIQQNPQLASSIRGVQQAVDQAARSYLKGMDGMHASTRKIVAKLTELEAKAIQLQSPFRALARLVGAGFGLDHSYESATKFNNALSALSISFRKYGIGVSQVEGALHKLSDATGLTLASTNEFLKVYEKGFNFNSLRNAESLLKNIQKVVGSDTDAIRQMTGEIASFAKQFPDLEVSLTRLEASDKKRLDSQTKLLYMTGKISQEQYRSIQDYLKGSSQTTAADQKKLKDLQAQQASIEQLKKAFEDVSLTVGKALLPLFQNLASVIKSFPNTFKGLAVASLAAPALFRTGAGLVGKGGKLVSTGGSIAKTIGQWLSASGGKAGMVGKALGVAGGAAETVGYTARKAGAQDVFVVGGKLDGVGGGGGLGDVAKNLLGTGGKTVAPAAGTYALAGEGTAATAAGAGAATAGAALAAAAAIGVALGSIASKLQGISFTDQAKTVRHPFDSLSAAYDYGFTEKKQQHYARKEYERQNEIARSNFAASRGFGEQDQAYYTASAILARGGTVDKSKSAIENRLAQIDEGGYAQKRARFDKLTDMVNSGKNLIGGELNDKEKAQLVEKQKNLGKELAEIEQKRTSLQNQLNGYEKAQNERVAVYRAQLEASNELLQQQNSLTQSILGNIGALGVSNDKNMEAFNKQIENTAKTMTDIINLQKQQISNVEQEQAKVKAVNAERRAALLAQKIEPGDKATLAKRAAELLTLSNSDTSADKAVEAARAGAQTTIQNSALNYARTVASKADVNRPQLERQERELALVRARSEMAQLGGNFGGAKSATERTIQIAREQKSNVDLSLRGVNESLVSERAAVAQAKTTEERQMHEAAIIELQNKQNQLQTDKVKYQKDEIEGTLALGRLNAKAIEQNQALASLQQTRMELLMGGGGAGAQGAGAALTATLKNEKILKDQEAANLAIRLKEAQAEALQAQGTEKEENAKAKVASIQKDYNDRQNESLQISKKITDAAKAQVDFNRGALDFQNARLSKMEAELELTNSLGAGLSASINQRMVVLDQMKQIETSQKAQLEAAKQQVAQAESAVAKAQTQDELMAAQDRLNQLKTIQEQKETAILQTQMRQANLLKSLRDGYINAISAMTAGSGLISKIMIDQNKNMGIGMENLGMLQSRTLGGIGSVGGGGSGLTRSSRFGLGGLAGPDADEAARRSPAFYNNAGQIGSERQRLLSSINGMKSMGSLVGPSNTASGVGNAVEGGSQGNFNTPIIKKTSAIDESISNKSAQSKANPTIIVQVALDVTKTGAWSKQIDDSLREALSGTGLLTGSNFRT